MAVQQKSKLGAGAPRHAAAPLNMAREALRPPVASLQSRGRFAAALHPPTKGRSCPLDTRPTLRGLDARQRRVPLHRQSGFRARHHEQGSSVPCTPARRCSPLTRTIRAPVGYAAPSCIDSQGFRAPDTHEQGRSVPMHPDERAFLPSRHQTNPARVGCAASACPVASTIRGFRAPDTLPPDAL